MKTKKLEAGLYESICGGYQVSLDGDTWSSFQWNPSGGSELGAYEWSYLASYATKRQALEGLDWLTKEELGQPEELLRIVSQEKALEAVTLAA